MLRRLSTLALPVVAALILPACGADDSKDYRFPVYPTDGKVVHKGQPVGKAIIRFHPADPSIVKFPEGKEGPAVMLTTETDENGLFSLSTYYGDDGVPAGDYKVTVATHGTVRDVENADDAKGKPAARPAAALRKYRDVATTTATASVKPGPNHLTIELD